MAHVLASQVSRPYDAIDQAPRREASACETPWLAAPSRNPPCPIHARCPSAKAHGLLQSLRSEHLDAPLGRLGRLFGHAAASSRAHIRAWEMQHPARRR